VGLSLMTYFIFWRSTLERTDGNLAELSEAFLTTVRAEMQDNYGPDAPKIATQEAILEHRFRDDIFIVLDPHDQLLATSEYSLLNPHNEPSSVDLISSSGLRKLVADLSRADHVLENVKVGGVGYRVFARKVPLKGQPYSLVILHSLHAQKGMLE